MNSLKKSRVSNLSRGSNSLNSASALCKNKNLNVKLIKFLENARIVTFFRSSLKLSRFGIIIHQITQHDIYALNSDTNYFKHYTIRLKAKNKKIALSIIANLQTKPLLIFKVRQLSKLRKPMGGGI